MGLRPLHAQRIALNMLWCSLLFWPWGTWPRETISGFFGRKALYGSRVAQHIVAIIDWMHPNETAHCYETACMEHWARIALEYHE